MTRAGTADTGVTGGHAAERCWGLSLRAWLRLALLAGLVTRIAWWRHLGGFDHPDEVFQYLEPAWRHIDGTGAVAWEYVQGLRSWILPTLYGGLLELGRLFGLERLELHRFVTGHDALVSLLLVPGAFKLGRALGRGDGRLAVSLAFVAALFPLFGYYGPRTMSEPWALLALTWGFAFYLESIWRRGDPAEGRQALGAGLLLGAAAVIRNELAVIVPLVLFDLVARAHWTALKRCCLGLTVAPAVLAVADTVAWGVPFHSVTSHLTFNLIEGGAASWFGSAPADFYWREDIGGLLGLGRPLLIAPALLLFWRHWRVLLAWLVPFAVLSAIAHKERRFVLALWPLLWAAGLSGIVALLDGAGAHLRGRLATAWRAGGALIVAGVVVGLSLRALGPVLDEPYPVTRGIFAAQAWVGGQPDATGVLIDDGADRGDPYAWTSGGAILLGRRVPLLHFDRALLDHRLYRYVISTSTWGRLLLGWYPGFVEVAEFEPSAHVFRRDR